MTNLPGGKEALEAINGALYRGTGSYRGNERFRKNLSAYRAYLVGNGEPAPTAPTLGGWFGNPPSQPKRVESFKFLHGFLLWASAVDPPLIEHGEVFDELVKNLRQRITDLAPELASAARPGAGAVAGPFVGLNRTLYERLEPIAGVYQLIRPYTSKADRYVLEVMSINTEAQSLDQLLMMYSHNQTQSRYRYSGYMNVNNKYCFGICTREHEDHDYLATTRCVVMHITSPEPCLSGIMLRGVSGLTTGKMAIGVPFVAIKSDAPMTALIDAEFIARSASLFEARAGVMLGEARKTDPKSRKMFEFCDALFLHLKSGMHNSNGFTLQTISSEDLWSTLQTLPGGAESYFAAWLACVPRAT